MDEELAAFWECVDLRGGKGTPWRYGLPALCKMSLVDYLTHLAFQVTAWHELVGTIIQYLLPNKKGAGPAQGMGFTVRVNQEENDVQVLYNQSRMIRSGFQGVGKSCWFYTYGCQSAWAGCP